MLQKAVFSDQYSSLKVRTSTQLLSKYFLTSIFFINHDSDFRNRIFQFIFLLWSHSYSLNFVISFHFLFLTNQWFKICTQKIHCNHEKCFPLSAEDKRSTLWLVEIRASPFFIRISNLNLVQWRKFMILPICIASRCSVRGLCYYIVLSIAILYLYKYFESPSTRVKAVGLCMS